MFFIKGLKIHTIRFDVIHSQLLPGLTTIPYLPKFCPLVFSILPSRSKICVFHILLEKIRYTLTYPTYQQQLMKWALLAITLW